MLAIYALGGGWGHLTRAVSLARLLSGPSVILTNSPYSAMVQAAEPTLHLEYASRDGVVARIQSLAPRVLVVDTFPRGLGGELAEALPAIAARKVLVQRDLEPRYVEWADLRGFVARHYDLVLVPGVLERGDFVEEAVVTDPWLVREPCHPPPEIDILICAGGNAEELAWYGEVASLIPRTVQFRCIAPECPPGCPEENWLRYWPAIDWVARVRVVIGSGGYNTVYECCAHGVPLVAKPWPRKYDRQARRAAHSASACVQTPRDAVQAAMGFLDRGLRLPAGAGSPPIEAAALLL
jgi:hypothetical protein